MPIGKGTHTVYLLRCPITKLVRYVGKSTQVTARYKQHIKDAKKGNTEKKRWILWLQQQGKQPILEVVDHFPDEHTGVECEYRTAEKYIQTIFNLFMPSHTCIETVSDYRRQNNITVQKTIFDVKDHYTDKFNKL